MDTAAPTRYWHLREDGRVQCDLCPRQCSLREGQRGLCFGRARRGDAIVLTTYGRSSGFAVDPIEKKPLFHFHPGSGVLSFGTAGCNLACRFCQNWDMSKATNDDILAAEASPEAIAARAVRLGCRSVAFTYNDPVAFHEYAVDTARACRARGIATVAVTAGYVNPEPRAEFYAVMDAANIDLKSFDDGFYRRYCGGRLAPVLETLEYVARHTATWLEVTTLLIPGLNDSPAEINALSAWVAEHLGPDTPLHFSAFHPAYRMTDRPPTPPSTLAEARRLARRAGLRFVYTGNVVDPEGQSTRCPACGALLVGRDWYRLTAWGLTSEGRCAACGAPCPGIFAAAAGLPPPDRPATR
ncbi:MAG: AmmeMemoRadiSam system radical SAM enzyme [Acidimicrobiia bacterium]|nr:AmmeMemoRadiSam system radical SAM enzyme [Acidimicrobiia bacterium]